MCKKQSSVILQLPSGKKIRIDKCMREKILKLNKDGFKTVACCCGHGLYPETIVFENSRGIHYVKLNWKVAVRISRKRKFYKKDDAGFYYIPEVTN